MNWKPQRLTGATEEGCFRRRLEHSHDDQFVGWLHLATEAPARPNGWLLSDRLPRQNRPRVWLSRLIA